MLTLRVTGVDDDGAGDDDDDAEELNEAVDDDEQSFHQGPGAVADPNIVRWQVKMKIVMTLTWLLTICSKIAGIGAGLDLSPPPPAPSSISASQNPLFLTVLRHL